MVKTRKVVPPTPYYYGARAELHRNNALQAQSVGDHERYLQQMTQCAKYTELAMQLQLAYEEVYDYHMETEQYDD